MIEPTSKAGSPRPAPWVAGAVLVVLSQSLLFTATVGLRWDRWLEGDAVLYELPAWNLVRGHGFTFGRHQWEDATLTALYREAHPGGADSWIPAVTLPPGYSFLLAGVYWTFGRSQLAAVLVNGLLLLATVAMMTGLVRRVFGTTRPGRAALAVVALFPDWAFWAGHVMSDTLHVFLITAFAWVFFRREARSDGRAMAAGALLGAATLVRPYSALLPVALALGWFVLLRSSWRAREFVILCSATWLLVGAWTVRNYHYFERLIPVTSVQLGFSMWMGTLEVGVSEAERTAAYEGLRQPDGAGSLQTISEDARLSREAVARIRRAPLDYALASVLRIPRLWTELAWGPATLPVSRLVARGYQTAATATKAAFAAVYLLLFGAMLAGIYRTRGTSEPILVGGLVLVVYYTAVFVPLHAEARYTLPARFFAILFAASALAPRAPRSEPAIRA